MSTLAELEAQQAALSLAFAQNDKVHVEAIGAALSSEATTALVQTLQEHVDALSIGNPIRKIAQGLIQIIAQTPQNATNETARLAALIPPAE